MSHNPYPNTDAIEAETIAIFNSLLDHGKVKSYVRQRDKVPNEDGYVELVDNENRPIGTIDVQIRKIKNGETKASCPTSLVFYSENGTLSPVIFIGIDTSKKTAYWCAVSKFMPGYNANQDSFTVRFDPNTDSVGNEYPYIDRWRKLIEDYKEQRTKYPQLKQELKKQIGLSDLSEITCTDFQFFIDKVNQHLDVNYPIIKSLFFADTWKIGVSIHHAADDTVGYNLYSIPKGENAPLITHVPNDPLYFANPQNIIPKKPKDDSNEILDFSQHTQSYHFHGRKMLEKAADQWIASSFKKILKKQLLTLAGDLLCREYIFFFMRRFYRALGLSKKNEYSIEELKRGFYVYFPYWYSLTLEKYLKVNEHLLKKLPIFPPFSAIAEGGVYPTQEETEQKIRSNQSLNNIPINPDDVNFKAFSQCLDYFFQKDVEKIANPYKEKEFHGGWIWNGYSIDALRNNIPLILLNLHTEYASLIKANYMDKVDWPHLQRNNSIIYSADLQSWAIRDNSEIAINYHILDAKNGLAPITFVDTSTESDFKFEKDEVWINNRKYKALSYGWTSASPLFHQQPILNILYSWIDLDVSNYLGTQISVCQTTGF
jgi:hypothetical protein